MAIAPWGPEHELHAEILSVFASSCSARIGLLKGHDLSVHTDRSVVAWTKKESVSKHCVLLNRELLTKQFDNYNIPCDVWTQGAHLDAVFECMDKMHGFKLSCAGVDANGDAKESAKHGVWSRDEAVKCRTLYRYAIRLFEKSEQSRTPWLATLKFHIVPLACACGCAVALRITAPEL